MLPNRLLNGCDMVFTEFKGISHLMPSTARLVNTILRTAFIHLRIGQNASQVPVPVYQPFIV